MQMNGYVFNAFLLCAHFFILKFVYIFRYLNILSWVSLVNAKLITYQQHESGESVEKNTQHTFDAVSSPVWRMHWRVHSI
jgi:hypothetical protein